MESVKNFGSDPIRNFELLKKNSYPGRGILVGMDKSGENLVQIYWIMGRSENSRNRIFVEEDGGGLKTALADPSKVKDPSLIIYTAMVEEDDRWAVSNGAQTNDMLHDVKLLPVWSYEPDDPNFTPRISALSFFVNDKNKAANSIFSILRKDPDSNKCQNDIYRYKHSFGVGYCVTTYLGDGNPLPAFQGEPYVLPLIGDINQIASTFWDLLNEENKISLAVKFVNKKSRNSTIKIINKYTQI